MNHLPLVQRNYSAIRLILIFSIVFILYMRTCSPSVYWWDSGEMTTGLWVLGLPHSPSFPFFICLSRLFMQLPISNIAARSNWISAFWGAFVVICTALTGRRLLPSGYSYRLMADVTALWMGLLPLFWFEGTKVEVYGLNLTVILIIVILIDASARAGNGAEPDTRYLLVAALLFGLGAGNHSLLLSHSVPGLCAFLFLRCGWRQVLQFRFLTRMTLFFLLGLSIYLYLPVRSATNPAIDLGDPQDIRTFLYSFTRKSSFNRFFGSTPGIFIDHLADYGKTLIHSYAFIALLIAVLGIVLLYKKRRTSLITIALFFGTNITVALINRNYGDNPDTTDAYVLLSHIALALFISAGMGFLTQQRLFADYRLRRLVILGILCWTITPLFDFVSIDLSDDATPLKHAKIMVDSLQQGSIVFTGYLGNLHFVLHYLNDVLYYRSDLAVISRPAVLHWHGYTETIRDRYPELIMPDLSPKGFALQRYYALFQIPPTTTSLDRPLLYKILTEVIKEIVLGNIDTRPIYWASSHDDGEFLHRLLPWGLLFRISPLIRFDTPEPLVYRSKQTWKMITELFLKPPQSWKWKKTREELGITYIAMATTLGMERRYAEAYQCMKRSMILRGASSDILYRTEYYRMMSRLSESEQSLVRKDIFETSWTLPER